MTTHHTDPALITMAAQMSAAIRRLGLTTEVQYRWLHEEGAQRSFRDTGPTRATVSIPTHGVALSELRSAMLAGALAANRISGDDTAATRFALLCCYEFKATVV